MRRPAAVAMIVVGAACWLAAGPGGVTMRALLACHHHVTHHMPMQHHDTPQDGPCFCDHMTGGLDLAVSPAVPAPHAVEAVVPAPVAEASHAALFPLPPSPSLPPASPPPDAVPA